MKYYIDGLSSEDIIKTYKVKKQKDGKYKIYITCLDEAAEKNEIKYNLTEEQVLEYQKLLNGIMIRQIEKFILLPNNVKEASEQNYILMLIRALLIMSYFIIIFMHKEEKTKVFLDTILVLLFNQLLGQYSNKIKQKSSLTYIKDLNKYRFYLSNYEQFISIGIYPNMIDYKTQNELETILNNLSNHSKVRVNMLNPNLK